MKLIDILVGSGDGMSFFGVHTKYLAMDPDGRVYGYSEMPSPTALGWGVPDALYATDGRGCLIQIDRDDVDGQWQSAIITREQYEAALAAKNDGWIEWGGGECPVGASEMVDVIFGGGGRMSTNIADCWRWSHSGTDSDIIAYRLHKPQEAAKADDEAELNECIGQDVAPVWSGEGLPPVGLDVEYKFPKANYRNDFSLGKVLAYGNQQVFMEHWSSKNEFIQPLDNIEFRPIRSEADKKREEAIMSIAKAGGAAPFKYGEKFNDGSLIGAAWYELYDAIAAGEIPGVKLED